jgi:hypothetical protein
MVNGPARQCLAPASSGDRSGGARSAARERLAITGLLIGGLVAGILALEVTLQSAAWVRGRDDDPDAPGKAREGVRRIRGQSPQGARARTARALNPSRGPHGLRGARPGT